MEIFKDITLNYLSSIEDDRVEEIILKRFSLNGNKKHTLDEIGNSLSITRERVRQLEAEHKYKLLNLALENENTKKQTQKIIELKEESRIQPAKVIRDILEVDTNFNEWDLFYLNILELIYFKDYEFLYTKEMNKTKLKKIIVKTRDKLTIHALPIEAKKLYNSIKIEDLTEVEFYNLVNNIKTCQKYTNGKLYFKLKVDDSWSAGNLAKLILWRNKEPMTTTSILEAMENNYGVNKKHLNTVNQMCDHECIENIDLHTWALKEWGLESNYVLRIMENVLEQSDEPLTVNEIIQEVKEKRDDVKERSIMTYTSLDTFIRVGNGRVALASKQEDILQY